MNLIRSRSMVLLLGLALAGLALHPVAPGERVLAWAVVPCRFLAELCVPVEWLRDQRARASESRVAVDFDGEQREHLALERMVKASALPDRFRIPEGAAAVNGEVMGRASHDLDRVRVRVEGCRGLVPGLPVISGDWFVGIVREVEESRSGAGADLWVQLITGQDERIAARVQPGEGAPELEQECRLVAGGLAPRADRAYLDIHNPSRRDVRVGTVLIDERDELGSRYTGLANGARLGELVSEGVDGKDVLGIRPGLDYGSGLYQVLVLVPEGLVQIEERERTPVLEDDQWRAARRFLRVEPSAWREGSWISLGLREGVRPGAAVVAGARLAGRVGQVGILRSSVHELGDPGLAVAGVAVLGEGRDRRPFVMGRIESRGRTGDGQLLFAWGATVPIEGDPSQPGLAAEIWTGSGEPGVPRGLWVGSAMLPRGPGPHLLRVTPPPAMARAGAWRVRVPSTSEGSEATIGAVGDALMGSAGGGA